MNSEDEIGVGSHVIVVAHGAFLGETGVVDSDLRDRPHSDYDWNVVFTGGHSAPFWNHEVRRVDRYSVLEFMASVAEEPSAEPDLDF